MSMTKTEYRRRRRELIDTAAKMFNERDSVDMTVSLAVRLIKRCDEEMEAERARRERE